MVIIDLLRGKISELFDFKLQLINRDGKASTPPPAYLLLPYYFDQDDGWSNILKSFERLSQYSKWKEPTIEYHTGIRPGDYYELASRGITPEQDAQRIAELAAYDESYAKTVRALNM